jgi:hypothetical protein
MFIIFSSGFTFSRLHPDFLQNPPQLEHCLSVIPAPLHGSSLRQLHLGYATAHAANPQPLSRIPLAHKPQQVQQTHEGFSIGSQSRPNLEA